MRRAISLPLVWCVVALMTVFPSSVEASKGNNQVQVPDELGGEVLLKQARLLAQQQQWPRAVAIYAKLLGKDHGVVKHSDEHYSGAFFRAFQEVLRLPRRGIEAFESLYGKKARRLLQEALQLDSPQERLQALSVPAESFFPTRAGQKAYLYWANELFLEGHFSQAAEKYLHLLLQESYHHLPIAPVVLLEKTLAASFSQKGLSQWKFQRLKRLYEHLKRKLSVSEWKKCKTLFLRYAGPWLYLAVELKSGERWEGRLVKLSDRRMLLESATRRRRLVRRDRVRNWRILHWMFPSHLQESFFSPPSREVLSLGGDNTHRGHSGRFPRLGKRVFGPKVFLNYSVRKRVYRKVYYYGRLRTIRMQSGEFVYPFHPVLKNNWLYLATPNQIWGVCLETPALSFRQRVVPVASVYERNAEILYVPALWKNQVYGTFIVDPNFIRAEHFRGIPIKEAIPMRRLFSFHRFSGKLKWVKDGKRDSFFKRASVPMPPIVAEGKVFAIVYRLHGYIQNFVVALEAETGETLWRRWISSGSQETTMFGYYAREPLSTMLAEKEGVLYATTNQGVIAALRAFDGKILWMRRYEMMAIRAAQFYHPVWRPIEWANNPPLVVDDKVVVAPMDSQYFYVLNRHTGELLWKGRRNLSPWGSVRYVVGAAKGILVLSGKNGLAYDLSTGKLLWRTSFGAAVPRGRGVIARGRVLFPLLEQPSRWNGYRRSEKWLVVDLERGYRVDELRLPEGVPAGNLYVSDDYVISVSENSVTVWENQK